MRASNSNTEQPPIRSWRGVVCRAKSLVGLLCVGFGAGLIIGLAIGGLVGYNWRSKPDPAPPAVVETKADPKLKEVERDNAKLKEQLRFRQEEVDELYRQLANRQFSQPQPAHIKPPEPKR